MNRTRWIAAAAAVLAVAGTARAEEPPKEGWFNTADLAYAFTSGNSESETLAFSYRGTGHWGRNGFEFRTGGLHAQATTTTIFAEGLPDNYNVIEQESTGDTAELYYATARYDRAITPRFYWFGSLGWDRNTFAGIDNRYVAAGGVGYIWLNGETMKFRTDGAATYTNQSDVVDNPDVADSYAGLRGAWAFSWNFLKNATWTNDLILDENLSETSDWRGDMFNALTVTMTDRLALKVGLRWLYDADPSFQEADLFNSFGANIGTVLVEHDSLDTIFTTSLVINF